MFSAPVSIFPSAGLKLSGLLRIKHESAKLGRGGHVLTWEPTSSTHRSGGHAGGDSFGMYGLEIPLEAARSLRVSTPHFGFGAPYAVLVPSTGIACPPLHFLEGDGGCQDLLESGPPSRCIHLQPVGSILQDVFTL